MSMERALDEWATILKNDIVFDSKSLKVLSDINLFRIGSL
jgi:hypothetical protein